jgi:hypothetical protein
MGTTSILRLKLTEIWAGNMKQMVPMKDYTEKKTNMRLIMKRKG